ncbi:MAG: hypothetical protein AAF602_14535 [Myxococcota bacterium]
MESVYDALGLCRAGEHVVRRVDEVRASTGVRVWSVVLGHRDARGVEPFSDDVLLLDPTEAAQAAGFVRRLRRLGRSYEPGIRGAATPAAVRRCNASVR